MANIKSIVRKIRTQLPTKRVVAATLMLIAVATLLFPGTPNAECAGPDCASAGVSCSSYAEADRQACLYLYSQDGTLTPAEGAACWDRHFELFKGCMAAWGCPLYN